MIFLAINLFNPYIALWERNLYIVGVERVINKLLCPCDIRCALLNQDVLLKTDVDAAVAKTLEEHIDAAFRVDYRTLVLVFSIKLFSGFIKHSADLLDISAVFHAHDDFQELIVAVTGEVLEVFVKQSGVGKRYYGVLQCLNLRGLVADS